MKLGVWEQVNLALSQQVRLQAGREAEPSLVIVDSQSVRLGQKRGEEIGVDGFKKVKGRKRHILVDVMGNVLWCYVSAANVADCKAAVAAITALLELYSRVAKVLADQAYRGELAKQVKAAYDCEVEISQRPIIGRQLP